MSSNVEMLDAIESPPSRTVATQTRPYAIRAMGLGKRYEIYESGRARLKQFIFPKLQRIARLRPKEYFREFWALQDVSFEIRKGETVGVIGRNGSGKSTLLQIICGTLTPTLGTVETQGRVSALLELGAGFNPEFTGRENVYLNGAIQGFTRSEMNDRFDDIASFADIGGFIEQPVKTYSSGMYVRLAFAVAINVDPDILIVDEALSVGDVRFQAKCMKRIKTLQQAGTTILFVSHDVGSVRTLCDRAIWIDEGRLRMDGDVFPVTGSFMAHLFEGDIAELEEATLGAAVGSPHDHSESEKGYDTKPVTHWGSHIGCIRNAGIYGADGQRADVFELGEDIEVRIEFRPPQVLEREDLSVAFSIKDLKGSDLIVSSTHDQKRMRFDSDSGTYRVAFRFRNPLVTGRYLLVAAVENRASPAIHYYEYLEGAHYFSSSAAARLFGVFQPEITQEVTRVQG
ncbi:ABC transporter ATP-binding protein [Cupriavidus gilardii]|uniref:ABC transporter ATP-binding protein n=1 Tax=Cupriavidus gilardii TaxID=82541 RepID=UPI001EE5CBAA|nr:ABC transporter ATP-binding protein [Cupriavidus gilardii]MCG5260321.1 ABC transporter ATP-binding protein [Cupriavidus gilardii]